MWGGSVSLPRQKSQFYFHIKYCNEFWSPTSCKLKAPYPRTFTIQRAVESEEKLATIGVSPGAQIMPLSSLVLPLIALPFVPSSLLLPGVKILQYLDWMNWLDTWWNSPNHLLYAQPRLLAGSFYVSPVDSQRVEMLNEKLPDFPEVKAHHLRSCLEKNITWHLLVKSCWTRKSTKHQHQSFLQVNKQKSPGSTISWNRFGAVSNACSSQHAAFKTGASSFIKWDCKFPVGFGAPQKFQNWHRELPWRGGGLHWTCLTHFLTIS